MKRIDKAIKRRIKSKLLLLRQKKLAREINILSDSQRDIQCHDMWEGMPTISIITPLYNTPRNFLEELLDSVEKQTYVNWQLCMADGSDDAHGYVEEICRDRQKRNPKIRYMRLQENEGIAENTNRCIELASGEYVGLLDHDDVLHESALYEMAKEISRSDADFLYSDEVKFCGRVEDAIDYNFKSPFSKDELRSHNYICHFTVFRKSLLDQVGGMFLKEYDGSQDHDLFLRLTEYADVIRHIPKVLYFWRVHEQSVSLNLDSKSYAVDSAIRAVKAQLIRTQEEGNVKSNLPYRTIYKVDYQLQKNKVTVILWSEQDSGKRNLMDNVQNIIRKTTYDDYEIIVPVYAEKEAEQIQVEDVPVEFLFVDVKGVGKLWNFLAQKAKGSVLLFIHETCIPRNDKWLQELLMFAQRKDVCAVGPKIYNKKRNVYSGGISLESNEKGVRYLFQGAEEKDQGYEAMLRLVRNVTALPSECIMLRKDVWESLNGFSEEMTGYESIDFCLKGLSAKMWNVWTCFSEFDIIKEVQVVDTELFKSKWKEEIAKDMSAHPHLKRLRLI